MDDDYKSYGVGAEIISSIVETDVGILKSSPQRVAYPDISVPFSPPMEQFALPDAEKVLAAAKKLF